MKATASSPIFQVQQKAGLRVVPAHPSPHCPTRPTPSNLPFFGFYSQSTAYTKASFHLGKGGKPKGLLGSSENKRARHLAPAGIAPPLQPAPKQTRALQRAPPHPRPGERCQRRGGRRQGEALGGTDEGRWRCFFTSRRGVSGTRPK